MSSKKEKPVQFILPFSGGAVNQCYYVDPEELMEKPSSDDIAALLDKAMAGKLSARSLSRHRDALLREAIRTNRAEALPTLIPHRRLEPDHFLELFSFAEKNGGADTLAWLLQYRSAHYRPQEFETLAERRLDLELGLAEPNDKELRTLFRLCYLRNGVCICGAREERRSYQIPAAIGGKAVVGVDASAFYSIDPLPLVRRSFPEQNDLPQHEGLSVGEHILLGRCMEKKGSAEVPLSWRVLIKKEGSALLLCDRPITFLAYNRESKDVTWESADIRRWLNTVFLPLCFTDREQAKLLTSNVVTPDNPHFGTLGGNTTEDRLFLLSTEEADTLTDTKTRALGCWWWLRTPGFDNSFASAVTPNGRIVPIGSFVDSEDYGVRPAVWIRT